MADGKGRIGFIGLGLMGQAFTRRLVACGYRGHRLRCRSRTRSRAAAAHGVRPAGSAAEVARASDQRARLRDDQGRPRGGGVRRGRHRRGRRAGQAPGRPFDDRGRGDQGVRRAAARRGRHGLGRCAGLGRAARGGGRHARDHGGRQRRRTSPGRGRCSRISASARAWARSAPGRPPRWSTRCSCSTTTASSPRRWRWPRRAASTRRGSPTALGAGYAGSTMLQKLYPRLVARDFAPAGYAFQALKDLDMVQSLAKELKVPTADERAGDIAVPHPQRQGPRRARRPRRAQAVRPEGAAVIGSRRTAA